VELPPRAADDVTGIDLPSARALVAIGLVAGLALAGGCRPRGRYDAARALAEAGVARLAPSTKAERQEYLRRARIFDDVDTAALDLAVGPPDPDAAAPGATVSCDFIEPSTESVPTGGTTPKFFCTLRHKHPHAVVKIRYGRANREVYGEVLGSRLFWALGVAVDRDYPVRVRCHGCPGDPWRAYRDFPSPDHTPRETREYDDAVMQRLYPAAIIETRPDEGWTFPELDELDPTVGGASRAEADALRLLAAFVAHGDDKPDNQRLVCPFDDIDAAGRCTRPRLLVADLGSTFGRGAAPLIGRIDDASRPNFGAWSSLPLWEDARACRVHLATRLAPSNPIISEAGRRFLADRLMQLSEQQIRALFTVARIERLGETTRGADGRPRPVTVDDWVAAFVRRRAALVEHHCGR